VAGANARSLGETYNIGGHNEWANIRIVEASGDLSRRNGAAIRGQFGKLHHLRQRSCPATTRYASTPPRFEKELGWTPVHKFEARGIAKPCAGIWIIRSGGTRFEGRVENPIQNIQAPTSNIQRNHKRKLQIPQSLPRHIVELALVFEIWILDFSGAWMWCLDVSARLPLRSRQISGIGSQRRPGNAGNHRSSGNRMLCHIIGRKAEYPSGPAQAGRERGSDRVVRSNAREALACGDAGTDAIAPDAIGGVNPARSIWSVNYCVLGRGINWRQGLSDKTADRATLTIQLLPARRRCARCFKSSHGINVHCQ